MKTRTVIFTAVLLIFFTAVAVRTINSQEYQKPKGPVSLKTDDLEVNNPNKTPYVVPHNRDYSAQPETTSMIPTLRTPDPMGQGSPIGGTNTMAGIQTGKDILATHLGAAHPDDMHQVAMTSHSNGNLYCAFENDSFAGDRYIEVSRSSDGGKNWAGCGWAWQPGNQLTDPSIAVTNDTVVIAYVVDNGTDDPYVEVSTGTLTQGYSAYTPHSILYSTDYLLDPHVFTDYHTYSASSSVYLVYEWVFDEAANNVNISFQRSSDDGATWKDYETLHGASDTNNWRDPHGSWGEGTNHFLHTVCFNDTDSSIYYRNSADWGVSFTTEQQVQTLTYLPASTNPVRPQIAARSAAGNDDVMVLYNSGSAAGDDDPSYFYTSNNGTTWAGPWALPGVSTEDEFGATLHANPRGGGWHACFTYSYTFHTVKYSKRAHLFIAWGGLTTINRGGLASMPNSQKGLTSLWEFNYPCFLWEDYDYHPSGNYSPYFNRLYPDDLVGTWATQGVYYRDDLNNWVKISTNPANIIAVGDLDGDNTADIVGDFPADGGAWVKQSTNNTWAFLGSSPTDMYAGDMDGDGTDDFMGTWASGCYFLDGIGGSWQLIATPATMVAAGDLNNDGTDDLIGVWPGQGGVWYKASGLGTWHMMGSTPRHIGAGDMDGDGQDELLGTWDGQGVYYLTAVGGSWVKLASPATLIACGDFDGDGTDDLAGIWPTQGGIWAKYSSTGAWVKLSSTADDLAGGMMRGGQNTWGVTVSVSLIEAMMTTVKEPGVPPFSNYSMIGPGGPNFAPVTHANLVPKASEQEMAERVPGPGEAGFTFTEQENLNPPEGPEKDTKEKIIRK